MHFLQRFLNTTTAYIFAFAINYTFVRDCVLEKKVIIKVVTIFYAYLYSQFHTYILSCFLKLYVYLSFKILFTGNNASVLKNRINKSQMQIVVMLKVLSYAINKSN